MIVDDLYGGNRGQFLAAGDADGRDTDPPELEWDESEVSVLVDEIIGRHRAAD